MKKRIFLVSSALTCAALTPAIVRAQDNTAPSEEEQPSTEIIVTATRREARTIDIPFNISAVSGDQIDARQTRDSSELLRSIPGLSVVDRGARNNATVNSVTIRGINVNSAALGDYTVSGVAPVSTYVNDTPLFAVYLLKDLERVEVLRGPQGTLYGSGALGGTVRYILKKPELGGEISGRSTVGISDVKGSESIGYEADAILNIPLGETFAIRGVLSRQDYPGITDYVNVYALDNTGAPAAPNGVLASNAQYREVEDADTVGVWFGRVSARWKPSDSFDATLTYNHEEDKIGGRRQITRGLDGFGNAYSGYENGSIQLEPSDRNVDSVSLEATIDLGFATLTSSSSYYDHEGSSISENTGFYARAGFLSFYYNYPRPMASAVRDYGDRSFIQEVRLVSDTGSTFDYVLGGYYQTQKLFSGQDSYLRSFKRWWDTAFPFARAAVTSDRDFLYRRNERFGDFALFGELTWHATPEIDLTVGGRQFWNRSRNRTLIDVPLYTSVSQPTNAFFETKDSKALFKGNLSWKFADEGLLYATVSEGYRRGGSNAVPLTGNFSENAAWQLYRPDSVVNYEVGVKGALGGLTYNLNGFYIDWQDIQLNTATPTWGFYVVQNGGSARSNGIEAQIEGRSGGLRYGFGYTFVDANLTRDFRSPDPSKVLIGRKGDQLPGSAQHVLTGSLDYSFPLGSNSELTLRADGFYQSATRNAISTSPRFNVRLPGFSLWNASATWANGDFALTAYIKNIFNEEGVTGTFTEAYMGSAPAVGYFGNGSKDLISLPRTLGLTASFNF